MLTEVKSHLKLMILSFKYNIQKEMTNRVSFIMQIVFMMLNNASFILQWIILFGIKKDIGGYGLNDVMVLWAISSAGYGISHMFFYNAHKISDLILNGKLDAFLVQPKNILFNAVISSTKTSAIGDLIYGYIVMIIVKPDIVSILLFTVFAITSGIIFTAFSVIMGSLSFWLKKGDMLTSNLEAIALNASTYPEGIFKGVIKAFLYIIVPTGFIVYVPVSVLLNFNIYLFLIVIAFTGFITSFAFFIFNKGLKRYSSSNLVSARV